MTARNATKISALPSVPLHTPSDQIIPGVPICLAAGTGPWISGDAAAGVGGDALFPNNFVGAPQAGSDPGVADDQHPANLELYKESVVCLPRGWIGFGGMLEFRYAGEYTITNAPVAGGTGWWKFTLDPLPTSATALSSAIASVALTQPYIPAGPPNTLDGLWELSYKVRAIDTDVQRYEPTLRVWNASSLASTIAAGTGGTPIIHTESGTVDLLESDTHWRMMFGKTGTVAGERVQVDWFQVILWPGQRIT